MLQGTGIRLQLVVGDPGDAILYRQPDDAWFTRYERIERRLPAVGAAASLLDEAVGDRPESNVADFLVCTHGRHDVCCGSMGTALAGRLAHAPFFARGDVTLHRTSHLGGHRYAPTALFLPDGTSWAFLDEGSAQRIIERRGPLDDLLPRYRGSCGLGPPAVQELEAIAFREVGWEWLDWRRRAHLHDGVATLEAEEPSGVRHSWRADVVDGPPAPVPVCGRTIDECKWRSAPALASVVRA